MKRMREVVRNAGWPAFIAVMAVCVLVINIFSIPAHDELIYSFCRVDGTAWTFDPVRTRRISSLADIARQQYDDWFYMNARVFVHAVVAFFAGFKLNLLFDVVNTAVWFVFVYFVMLEARIERSVRNFAICAALAFSCFWFSENSAMNAAFAVNYLWMACFAMLTMRMWRNCRSWLYMPVAFVFGWGQETFSLPMVAALVFSVLLDCVRDRKIAIDPKRAVFLLCMVLGAAFLVLSPAARGRAYGIMPCSAVETLVSTAKYFLSMSLYVWPALLFAVVIFSMVADRRAGRLPDARASREWPLFFIFAFLFACVAQKNGICRVSSAWIAAGMIIVLQRRSGLIVHGALPKIIAVSSTVFMLGGAAFQTAYGLENLRMLERYKASRDGVVWRHIPAAGLFANICNPGVFNQSHLEYFAYDCGMRIPPIILPRNLYFCLYTDPARFFKNAVCVDGMYVNNDIPRIAVIKGDIPFTEEQKRKCEELFKPNGLLAFFPGRIRLMFHGESYNGVCDFHSCVLTASDGRKYSIYIP